MEENRRYGKKENAAQAPNTLENIGNSEVQKQKENDRLLYRAGYVGRKSRGAV